MANFIIFITDYNESWKFVHQSINETDDSFIEFCWNLGCLDGIKLNYVKMQTKLIHDNSASGQCKSDVSKLLTATAKTLIIRLLSFILFSKQNIGNGFSEVIFK